MLSINEDSLVFNRFINAKNSSLTHLFWRGILAPNMQTATFPTRTTKTTNNRMASAGRGCAVLLVTGR